LNLLLMISSQNYIILRMIQASDKTWQVILLMGRS
jgi:hypothetical protein